MAKAKFEIDNFGMTTINLTGTPMDSGCEVEEVDVWESVEYHRSYCEEAWLEQIRQSLKEIKS